MTASIRLLSASSAFQCQDKSCLTVPLRYKLHRPLLVRDCPKSLRQRGSATHCALKPHHPQHTQRALAVLLGSEGLKEAKTRATEMIQGLQGSRATPASSVSQSEEFRITATCNSPTGVQLPSPSAQPSSRCNLRVLPLACVPACTKQLPGAFSAKRTTPQGYWSIVRCTWVTRSSLVTTHGSPKSCLDQSLQIEVTSGTLSSCSARNGWCWQQTKLNKRSWVGLEPSVRCKEPAQLRSSQRFLEAQDSIHRMALTLQGSHGTTILTPEVPHCLA